MSSWTFQYHKRLFPWPSPRNHLCGSGTLAPNRNRRQVDPKCITYIEDQSSTLDGGDQMGDLQVFQCKRSTQWAPEATRPGCGTRMQSLKMSMERAKHGISRSLPSNKNISLISRNHHYLKYIDLGEKCSRAASRHLGPISLLHIKSLRILGNHNFIEEVALFFLFSSCFNGKK